MSSVPNSQPTNSAVSRRGFLVSGVVGGVAGAIGLSAASTAEAAAVTGQAQNVVIVDTVGDLPPGTPAGTLVVVRT